MVFLVCAWVSWLVHWLVGFFYQLVGGILVSWFDGLSTGLHKNCGTDFHETWVEGGSWPRIDPNKLWCRSEKRDEQRNLFSRSLTMQVFETMRGSW